MLVKAYDRSQHDKSPRPPPALVVYWGLMPGLVYPSHAACVPHKGIPAHIALYPLALNLPFAEPPLQRDGWGTNRVRELGETSFTAVRIL